MQQRPINEHPQNDPTIKHEHQEERKYKEAYTPGDHKPVEEKIQENIQHAQGNVQNAVEQAQKEVTASRVPWYRVTKRTYILLTIYALQLALFATLAVFVYIHPVFSIDVTITREFQENQTPWLRNLMIAVSYIGNTPALSFGLVILTPIIFWLLRLRLEAVMILGLSVVSAILNGLLKLLIGRPRPTSSLVEIIQHAGGQSFPSGHVMSYVAFWGLLFSFGIILFKRDRWWLYILLLVSAFFVVLVGPSRIYLGDHWASDVLGAYLIGGVLLGITLWLYLRLKERGVLALKASSRDHLEPPPQNKLTKQNK